MTAPRTFNKCRKAHQRRQWWLAMAAAMALTVMAAALIIDKRPLDLIPQLPASFHQ
jgi:hypothetical protein